jgi:hypothetical protein
VLQTPGGIGPFELTTQQVLVFYNVSHAGAAAYALALHVLLLAPVVLVGIVLIWTIHLSFSQLFGIPGPAKALPSGPASE